MRTAKVEDFKIGVTLIDKEGGIKFRITSKEQDGVWVARCGGGEKCVFECEASGYEVAE